MATLLLILTVKPTGKARAKVSRKIAYLPKEYREWRRLAESEISSQLLNAKPEELEEIKYSQRVKLDIMVYTKTGNMRPDVDNAAGAIMDALQSVGVVENDRSFKTLIIDVRKGNPCIYMKLTTE